MAELDVTVQCPFNTAYLSLEMSAKGIAFSLDFDRLPGFEELRRCKEAVPVIWNKVDYLDGSIRKAKVCLWQKNSGFVPQF